MSYSDYMAGLRDGAEIGFKAGFRKGYDLGYKDGTTEGFLTGYTTGYLDSNLSKPYRPVERLELYKSYLAEPEIPRINCSTRIERDSLAIDVHIERPVSYAFPTNSRVGMPMPLYELPQHSRDRIGW